MVVAFAETFIEAQTFSRILYFLNQDAVVLHPTLTALLKDGLFKILQSGNFIF